MKDLATGKLSGPPMPHDEWKKNQDELDRKALAAQAKGGGAATEDLDELTVEELKDRARDEGVIGFSTLHKDELIKALKKSGGK